MREQVEIRVFQAKASGSGKTGLVSSRNREAGGA